MLLATQHKSEHTQLQLADFLRKTFTNSVALTVAAIVRRIFSFGKTIADLKYMAAAPKSIEDRN